MGSGVRDRTRSGNDLKRDLKLGVSGEVEAFSAAFAVLSPLLRARDAGCKSELTQNAAALPGEHHQL